MDSIHQKELDDLAALRALPTTGGPLGPDEKARLLAAIENLVLDQNRMKRAAIFTLGRMRNLGIGLGETQVQRNFADLPAYRTCLARNVGAMLRFMPISAGGPLR